MAAAVAKRWNGRQSTRFDERSPNGRRGNGHVNGEDKRAAVYPLKSAHQRGEGAVVYAGIDHMGDRGFAARTSERRARREVAIGFSAKHDHGMGQSDAFQGAKLPLKPWLSANHDEPFWAVGTNTSPCGKHDHGAHGSCSLESSSAATLIATSFGLFPPVGSPIGHLTELNVVRAYPRASYRSRKRFHFARLPMSPK